MFALLGLCACGDRVPERAVSGGAVGAGIGAIGGAILVGDPVDGAIIGGATGAAVGAFTQKQLIDLDHSWDHSN